MANVMKDVAKALGLELGEEFSIGDTDKYVLLDDGLFKTIGELTYWQVDIENLLTGEWDVVKLPKPILDDVEREYLGNIIKPFRKNIITIRKIDYYEHEYIEIFIYRPGEIVSCEAISFPYFNKGEMYKGMEIDKEYTLDELGL